MSNILRDIGNALNPFAQRGPVPQNVNRGMSTKCLTSHLGTKGAGKTTADCLLTLAARTLQQQLPGFYMDIDDRNSTIMRDVSNLQRGHFPPKTKAFDSYAHQYACTMWWDGPWGKKSTTLNNVDLAGEDFMAVNQYQFDKPDDMASSQAMRLVQYAMMSDIFILDAPASRALLFENDVQIEREDEDIAFDPDVNLASITGSIFNKRKQMRKPIKGVLLFITKADMIKSYVQQKHKWDIFDSAADRLAFVNQYFPFTSMKLKALSGWSPKTKVMVLPMFIDTAKNPDGSVKRWETGDDAGNPVIEIDQQTRLPSFGSGFCVQAINFLGQFA